MIELGLLGTHGTYIYLSQKKFNTYSRLIMLSEDHGVPATRKEDPTFSV